MKTSDLIVKILEQSNFKFAAGVSGGAIMHLMHSLESSSQIRTIFTHHEQAAVMSVDGFNRASPINRGLVFATSGPGATNLLTGLAGAYYDSVPLLAITGQASTFRQVSGTGVRQIGFQETPIVEMASPVTKFAAKASCTREVPGLLLQAIQIMDEGRKGPVLIDIPDDILRSNCEEEPIIPFRAPTLAPKPSDGQIISIVRLVRGSNRPVIVLGAGINSSPNRHLVRDAVAKLGVPVLFTWGAADLLDQDHDLYVGLFGTHGERIANFVVQNSDLVLSFGSKLDTKSTGSPVSDFAPNARKIMVDIDQFELDKFDRFELEIHEKVRADAYSTLSLIANSELIDSNQFSDWKSIIQNWRKLLHSEAITEESLDSSVETVRPRLFFEALSAVSGDFDDFIVDTGNTLGWFLAHFKRTNGQRFWHDFNNTAMGWSIPASIGVGFANNSKFMVVIGDGSLMMTLGDLVTLRAHHPKVKVFVINNGGYSMIRQTQTQWFESSFIGSDLKHLTFPDLGEIASASGYIYSRLSSESDLLNALIKCVGLDSACLVEVIIAPSEKLEPQVKFGNKLDDMEPFLPREIYDSITQTP